MKRNKPRYLILLYNLEFKKSAKLHPCYILCLCTLQFYILPYKIKVGIDFIAGKIQRMKLI